MPGSPAMVVAGLPSNLTQYGLDAAKPQQTVGDGAEQHRVGGNTGPPPQGERETWIQDSFAETGEEFFGPFECRDEYGILKIEALGYGSVLGRRRRTLSALSVDGARKQRTTLEVADGVVVAQERSWLIHPHTEPEAEQVLDRILTTSTVGCGQQADDPRLGRLVVGIAPVVLTTAPPGLERSRQPQY